MEQLNKGQPKPTLEHFSHPHALTLKTNQNQSLCSGCNHTATGLVYSCTPCGFFLHISCSQMPRQITHPCDKSGHALSLLPKPAHHNNGVFKCAACLKDDTCFSYHCATCSIDLHITCAAAPLALPRQRHHHHPLSLAFSPPYPHETFKCDVCSRVGVKGWVYRCETCGFDSHFECAKAKPNAAAASPAPNAAASGQFDAFSFLRSYNSGNPMGMGSGTNNIYGQGNYNNSINQMIQQTNAQNYQMIQNLSMQAKYQNMMNQIMLRQFIGRGGGGGSGGGSGGGGGGGGGAGLFGSGGGGSGANTMAFGGDPTTMAFGGNPTTTAFGSDPSTMAFGGDPTTIAFGGDPTTMAFGGDPTTAMPPGMADYLNGINGSGFDFSGSFSGSGIDFAGGFDFGGLASGFSSLGLF